jgi:hypothetical protein
LIAKAPLIGLCAFLGLTAALAGTAGAQGFPSDSAAHMWLRESPRWAVQLAGCYSLSAPIHDSVIVRRSFRLLSSEVRALGYHRIRHFWTNLPRDTLAETRPIWTPYAYDSLQIELRPRSTGLPRFLLALKVTGDSIAGAYLDRTWRWIADSSPVQGPRLESVRSIPVRGRRLACP